MVDVFNAFHFASLVVDIRNISLLFKFALLLGNQRALAYFYKPDAYIFCDLCISSVHFSFRLFTILIL